MADKCSSCLNGLTSPDKVITYSDGKGTVKGTCRQIQEQIQVGLSSLPNDTASIACLGMRSEINMIESQCCGKSGETPGKEEGNGQSATPGKEKENGQSAVTSPHLAVGGS